MDIRIGIKGVITKGEFRCPGGKEFAVGWHIMIQEAVGGYLILYSRNFEDKKAEGYDDWVERTKLNSYFDETGFQIKWLET